MCRLSEKVPPQRQSTVAFEDICRLWLIMKGEVDYERTRVNKQTGDSNEAILLEKEKFQTKLSAFFGQYFGRSHHPNRHMRLHAVKADLSEKKSLFLDIKCGDHQVRLNRCNA